MKKKEFVIQRKWSAYIGPSIFSIFMGAFWLLIFRLKQNEKGSISPRLFKSATRYS